MNCSIRKNSITYIEDSPQLIFLTYKVYNKDNKYSAVLVDSITKPGKLKDNDKTLAVNISGNYQIKQSDQKSKELEMKCNTLKKGKRSPELQEDTREIL